MAANLHLRQVREGSGEPMGEPGSARAAEPAGTASRLLDPLIEDASELVRQRLLLPAYDWRHASPEQVARLLQKLSEARVNVPAWLAKGLLIAGHVLPESALRNCSPELLVLAAVNDVDSAALPDSLSRQILACAQSGDMEAGVAVPLVRRLAALGCDSLAARVALSQCRASPEAMRHVGDQVAAEIAAMPSLRVRVAGTSTTHGLAEALRPAFAGQGQRAEIEEADFGAVISELLNAEDDADLRIILLDRAYFMDLDWRKTPADLGGLVSQRLDTLADALQVCCRSTATPLLVNTLPASVTPAAGHVDRHHPAGEAFLIGEVNRRLAELAATVPSLHLVDADLALAPIAPGERTDSKLWYYGRVAYSEPAVRALASGFARAWRVRQGGLAKVLALDFDNTLWGGVFGDDGISGLSCGDDFPGNAFKALQQECLRLKAQGMLLVGLSKNNADAIDVFSRHPGMALTSGDFVATAIDWEPKPDNIRRIAAELGLGLDSFVFLDDSVHEREAMRRMCPAVIVPEMPTDPARRPEWLRSLACTWPLRLTEEDGRRSDMYIAERRGRELRETAGSYEDYLAALQQRLVVAPVQAETLARAAQLHQRTNQFNLTTRRLSESDLQALMNDKAAVALLGRVSDRFGDHGIVLAASATIDGATARIETFVMSCRVIGRRLEAAFLDALTSHLAKQGVKRIEAIYRPTAKNGIAREFYPSMGFVTTGRDDNAEHWVVLTEGDTAPPLRPVSVEWGEL